MSKYIMHINIFMRDITYLTCEKFLYMNICQYIYIMYINRFTRDIT